MSDHHPINDIKTPDELASHTYRSVIQVLRAFFEQQQNRFPDEQVSEVFIAIHRGAFDAVVASMCAYADLPVDVAARIAVTHFNIIDDTITDSQ